MDQEAPISRSPALQNAEQTAQRSPGDQGAPERKEEARTPDLGNRRRSGRVRSASAMEATLIAWVFF